MVKVTFVEFRSPHDAGNNKNKQVFVNPDWVITIEPYTARSDVPLTVLTLGAGGASDKARPFAVTVEGTPDQVLSKIRSAG